VLFNFNTGATTSYVLDNLFTFIRNKVARMDSTNQNKDKMDATPELAIKVTDLTFRYNADERAILNNLNMELPAGSRCLLIGANGAGKSTLLRLLGGKHLVKPDEAITVLGMNPFRDTALNFQRAYLDMDWGMRTVAFAGYGVPLQADIPVHGMMSKLQNEYPERRDELIDILGIDINWRMHKVSDGQRRRVQIFLGLVRPFKILLLDEVTTSLDVLVRQDLLRWLKKECEQTGCTILYATHIFDGLDDWPTHVHYLTNKGDTGFQGELSELQLYHDIKASGASHVMLTVAETWLRAELLEKRKRQEMEAEEGEIARQESNDLQRSTNSAGGFAAGRMGAYLSVG